MGHTLYVIAVMCRRMTTVIVMTKMAITRVASMPDRSFNNSSDNTGASLESGSSKIDHTAKDTHQARVIILAMIMWMMSVVMVIVHSLFSYSPLLTQLSP